MIGKPNGPHFDMSSPLIQREEAQERFATHEYLLGRFGEAITHFCETCGWPMTKQDDFGEFYCTNSACGVPWPTEEEEAA